MAHRFIVTVSAVGMLTACASAKPPESEHPEISRNPPPQPPPADSIPAEPLEVPKYNPPSPPKDPPRSGVFTTALNPYSDKEGMIYREMDRCVTYPSDGQMRPPGARPPAHAVTCPPLMNDYIWVECIDGTAMANADRSACVCFIGGNPPPPETWMSRCPAEK